MAQESSQLPIEWPEKYQTEYNKGNVAFNYVFKIGKKKTNELSIQIEQ